MLTAKMNKAAYLIYQDELTDEQIAKQCGISRKTLGLWKKKPEFIDALSDMSTKQQERAFSVLENNAEHAANTLIELTKSDSDSVRLRASLELLRITKADKPKEKTTNDNASEVFERLIEEIKI